MVPITALWLPILLSAVIVFVASSILHMVIPYHKSDYRKLPEEDKVRDTLRAVNVTPGRTYHFPYTTHKEMKSPEAVEKFKRGPIGLLTIIPSGPPAMGKYLGLWFVYCVVVGIFSCLPRRTHACPRNSVPGSVPRGWHCRLHGIRIRADSRLNLEGADLGRDRQACG